MPTVMVVDDDVDVCGMLKAFLSLEGFDVLTATNGSEALRQLHERRPAVILLDLMMPIMDGVEFRRQQQRVPLLRNIPVVCLRRATTRGRRPRVWERGVPQQTIQS